MITVMGANGHTAKPVVETLLAQGEKVRALGRSKDKLEPLSKLGAEIRVGDATDVRFMTEAFRGSDAVYTLLPPDPTAANFRKHQDQLGEAIIAAVKESGVKRVVFLSSIGADKAEGTGPIAGLHHQEERLKKLSGTDVLAIRPGYFYENFGYSLGMIKAQGINGAAIKPDLQIPMIASRDIGAFAAKALKERSFRGFSSPELRGPRDYTMAEATAILGARIGKPDLKYVQFPYADFEKAMVANGLSPDMARLYAEMAKAFNEGHAKSLQPRSPASSMPTRFEDFAEILAAEYRKL